MNGPEGTTPEEEVDGGGEEGAMGEGEGVSGGGVRMCGCVRP